MQHVRVRTTTVPVGVPPVEVTVPLTVTGALTNAAGGARASVVAVVKLPTGGSDDVGGDVEVVTGDVPEGCRGHARA